jgi:hypothetical protein
MSLSIQPPYPVVNDTDGQPLENGYIWIGTANLNPQTNPISIYWDAALTQPAAQPVRTLGGYPANAGNPGRLYAATNYSILVQNSRGVTLYSAPQQTELYGTASGGTGLTSYVVGDLLYADGTASLARLADVATGNVLRSGGVATAPAWGKVDLATDTTGDIDLTAQVTGTLPAANGGTGLSSPGASGNVLSSDGATWQSVAVSTLVPDATDSVKGVVELATDAEVRTGTDTTRAITPDALRKGALVLDTVQASTSGTAIDFTGIPSWAKRITVIFAGVSTNGSNFIDIQIGDSGGIEATGYAGAQTNIIGGATGGANYSGDAFELRYNGTSYVFTGHFVLTLLNSATNLWVGSGVHGVNSGLAAMAFSAGQKTLSGALDRLRISAGGDTFDAGSINIMYE